MPVKLIIVAALVVVSWLWVSDSDYREAVAEHEHYCEMVEIYKATGGASGWPDDGRDCK